MANAFVPPPINPALAGQLGMQNPFMPPPAASPSLGFQVYASDPQNAMKVQHAMVPPNQPLQPNAGQPSPMASVNPPKPTPMAAVTPPEISQPVDVSGMGGNLASPSVFSGPSPAVQSGAQAQLGQDQAELQRLQQSGAAVNHVKNPVLRTLGQIGNIAAPFLLGRGAMAIPGTTAHNLWLQNQQQGRVTNDQGAIQAQAQLADTQSQTALRNSQAAKADAQGDAYAPVLLTPEQANAIGFPDLAGSSMDPRHVAVLMAGKQKGDVATGIENTKATTATNIATGKNQTEQKIADQRNARITQLANEANKTKVLLQGMRDSTSTANTDSRIAGKGATGGKVPTDVTKRAALATNTIENANAVTGLITKRPEIVGAVGGRYSSVQQMIGSDDPDIQELGVRMHNIALASNGAHGIRSAEAVAQTEHELFNNFKAGPHGIAGGLKGLTDSVGTFLQDEKNFQETGSRAGNPLKPPATGGNADFVYVPGKGLVKQ